MVRTEGSITVGGESLEGMSTEAIVKRFQIAHRAFQYDSQILVEQWIRGQEISVAVVEDRLGVVEDPVPRARVTSGST